MFMSNHLIGFGAFDQSGTIHHAGANLLPVFSGYTATGLDGQTVTITRSADDESGEAWKISNGVLTGDAAGGWYTTMVNPSWIIFDFGTPQAVGSYKVSGDNGNYNPTAFTFRGSTDGFVSSDVALDTRAVAPANAPSFSTYTLGASAEYRWFKINVTASAGAFLRIAEMQIIGV